MKIPVEDMQKIKFEMFNKGWEHSVSHSIKERISDKARFYDESHGCWIEQPIGKQLVYLEHHLFKKGSKRVSFLKDPAEKYLIRKEWDADMLSKTDQNFIRNQLTLKGVRDFINNPHAPQTKQGRRLMRIQRQLNMTRKQFLEAIKEARK